MWGAQGGSSDTAQGGKGGYSKGVINLNKGQILYVVVGGAGKTSINGGYNGGGKSGYYPSRDDGAGSGGGATHIAYSNQGELKNYSEHEEDLIIVAGGGGGYYGGGSSWGGSPGGGSGYIGNTSLTEKVMYGYNVSPSNEENTKTISTTNVSTSPVSTYAKAGNGYAKITYLDITYADEDPYLAGIKVNDIDIKDFEPETLEYTVAVDPFTTSVTIDTIKFDSRQTVNLPADLTVNVNNGINTKEIEVVSPDGSKTTTYTINIVMADPRLATLTVENGEFQTIFNPNDSEYDVIVDSEADYVIIDGAPITTTTEVVYGFGRFDMPVGTTDITVMTTSYIGNIFTYTLHLRRNPSSYAYLNDIKVNGVSIEDFDPETLTYTINTDLDTKNLAFTAEKGKINQKIELPKNSSIYSGSNEKKIVVIAEDKVTTNTYTIVVNKDHSSKLKTLSFGYDFSQSFEPETTEYIMQIPQDIYFLQPMYEAYDDEATVKVTGNGYMKNSGTIYVTVTEPNSEQTKYTIRVLKSETSIEGTTWNYPHTGEVQTWVAPKTGTYKLEVWGAQGGDIGSNSSIRGGYGGYSTGVINAIEGEEFFIVVGGQGWAASSQMNKRYYNGSYYSNSDGTGNGGYNGGGTSRCYEWCGGGGGATHIASTSGVISNIPSSSLIIVAGGGGGVSYGLKSNGNGAEGGGYIGNNGLHLADDNRTLAYGGTQESGGAGSYNACNGSYGQGASQCVNGRGASGGGGGYYGGGSSWGGSPGGGSGYIGNELLQRKVMYGYNVKESEEIDTKTISTTNVSSTPISNYAKSGSGYSRITALRAYSEDNFLRTLTGSVGKLDQTFSSNVQEYTLDIGDNESVIISATSQDPSATITGTGEYDLSQTTTKTVEIVVTSESGKIRTYTVNIVRNGGDVSDLIDIKIRGLIPEYCVLDSTYCKTNPETFAGNHYNYSMTVPSMIRSVNFVVEKYLPGQTVINDGIVYLNDETTVVSITSTSEDLTETSVYTYTITRDIATVADLKTLELSVPSQDIGFDPQDTEYRFSVENHFEKIKDVMDPNIDLDDPDTAKLIIETEDPNATYIVTGGDPLYNGENIVNIVVTSQKGYVKTYTLKVNRDYESNVYLRDITVKKEETEYEINPEFNKLIRDYKVTVENEVSSVTLEAYSDDPTATVLATGLVSNTGHVSGDIELRTGNNIISIVVTAEDGSLDTYELVIYRNKNNNANLTNVVVKDKKGNTYELDSEFDKDKLAYNVEFESEEEEIEFEVTPEEETTTYKELDGGALKTGTNTKRIMAIAEDGTSKTYTIVINKKNVIDNTYLESVTIESPNEEDLTIELSPEFDKEEQEYDVILGSTFKTGSIKVKGIPEDSFASVEGNGTYSINVEKEEKEGYINVVVLTVTAQDGETTREYTFNFKSKGEYYAGLCDLGIEPEEKYTISPEFDGICGEPTKEIEEYELNYEVTLDESINEITFNPVGSSEYVKITGDVGTHTISGEEEEYEIVTTSYDDKETLTYKITVKRSLSSNTKIKHLDILSAFNHSEEILTSDKGVFEVSENLEILPETDWIVELEDERSSYEIIGPETLVKGENEYTIRVEAEDGSSEEYSVTVKRQENVEGYYLSLLSVNEGELDPAFDKYVEKFEVIVGNEVEEIEIEAMSETPGIPIKGIGTKELEIGWNYFKVELVDDVNNTTKVYRTYFVNVYRNYPNEARLSRLEIQDTIIKPGFNKDTYEYSIKTNNKRLIFDVVETVDKKATYEIIGNSFEGEGNYTVTIRVTAQDETTTKDYTINVERKLNANTYLKSLDIDYNEISPEFKKTITSYELETTDDILYITAKPEAETSTVEGDGIVKLTGKEQAVEITVISEVGTTRTYTIDVTKYGDGNNKIRNLVINNGTIKEPFHPEQLTYTVNVPYEETELDMEIVLDSEGAKYVVSGNSDFEVGTDNIVYIGTDNIVYIIVTAENGSVNTYTLNVERERMVSAYLEELDEANYNISPEFDKYINNYNLIVNNETDELDLTIVPEDELAEVEVYGNENLELGDNTVTITVTRKDEEENVLKTEVYILNVYKQNEDNSYLNYIYTDHGELVPEFDKEVMKYKVDVPNKVEEIEVFAQASVKSSQVYGTGKYELEPGVNDIYVKVITEKNIERTYYITINRAKKDGNDLLGLVATSPGITHTLIQKETEEEGFDKTVLDYKIDVGNEVNSITFYGRASEGALVTGLGEFPVYGSGGDYKIKVISEEGEEKEYTITVNRELSDNNRLTNLVPSVGELEPSFLYDETIYELTLESSDSKLSFEVELENQYATVTGIEEKTIPGGISTRTITVTAENGEIREYTIMLNKAIVDNSLLSRLSVNGYELEEEFEAERFEYTVKVPYEKVVLTEEEVEAEAQDAGASIEKTEMVSLLTTEENKFLVIVTAVDGITTSTYTINVEREKNDNSKLMELEPKVGTLEEEFDPEEEEYTWKVPYSTKVVSINDIKYKLADENASIEYSEAVEVEKTGEVVFSIKVTSENGEEETTYNLNISYDTRTNALLESLTVDKGRIEPEFESDTFEYNVYEYADEEEIEIEAIPQVSTSTVSGDGEIELTGLIQRHNVSVTSESGMTENYVLNIYRIMARDEGLRRLGLRGLEELRCKEGECELTPEFETEKLDYRISVPYEYETLDLIAEKMNGQQTLKYYIDEEEVTSTKDYELPLGITNIKVEVYNGFKEKTSTYTLEIERRESSNNYLRSLEVEGYEIDPEFDKEVEEYKIEIPYNVESVTVEAEVEFEGAIVNISGNEDIPLYQSEIIVSVEAKNGDIREYKIKVLKVPEIDNILETLTVKDNYGNEQILNPEFNSGIETYEVGVSRDVESVTVEAEAHSTEAEVRGEGNYEINNGENNITVTVINGEEKIYNIKVIRLPSSNTYLKDLKIEGETIEGFDKETEEYEISIEYGIDEIEVEGEAESTLSNVRGNRNYELVTGKNYVVLEVEAENGDTREYKITIDRKGRYDFNIINIIPSEGELDPEFENDGEDSYILKVDEEIESVDIEVEAEEELEIEVIGNENIEVEDEKEITLLVQTKDGRIREIEIKIVTIKQIRGVEIKGEEEIEIFEGEEYQIEAEVTPEGVLNSNIVYESLDEEIAEVDEEGKITGIKEGSTKIKVKAEGNTEIYSELKVKVQGNKIKSEEYEVMDTEYGKIVIGAEPNTKVEEFIDNLLNEKKYINVYTKEEEKEENENKITTGMKVRLETEDKVYDEATIIVRGDINEDGKVDISDIMMIQNHKLNKNRIEGYLIYAANIVEDTGKNAEYPNNINISDLLRIQYYKLNIKGKPKLNVKENIVISLDKTTIGMYEGDEETVTALIKPDTLTNKNIIYESLDEEVATVDENGKITGIGEGSTTITAKLEKYPNVYEKITVTVVKR